MVRSLLTSLCFLDAQWADQIACMQTVSVGGCGHSRLQYLCLDLHFAKFAHHLSRRCDSVWNLRKLNTIIAKQRAIRILNEWRVNLGCLLSLLQPLLHHRFQLWFIHSSCVLACCLCCMHLCGGVCTKLLDAAQREVLSRHNLNLWHFAVTKVTVVSFPSLDACKVW